MGQYKAEMIEKRARKVIENLGKNNMHGYFVTTKEEALAKVEELLEPGSTIASGGSMTLRECGIMELLRNGSYHYLDREKLGLSREQIEEIYQKAFSADAYLCSCNAVTDNGELYNVDGNSNRVAAICYGPASVIIVAGYNKIVKNIEAAVRRVKTVAAPANCRRLHCKTYCAEKGECISLSLEQQELSGGCAGEDRVCCNYVVNAKQRKNGRIKVILVGEELGY